MADPIRKSIRKALSSPTWRRVSRWVRGLPDLTELEAQYSEVPIDSEVIVYFGDTKQKTYQIIQWLPVLEELNKTHSVTILLRRLSAIEPIAAKTDLPIVCHQKFHDLMTAVHQSQARVAIYVNNGSTNFQLLSYAPLVHVHVNHGESDKISMVSNQAKAYDRVFVAGQAAIDRHHRALMDFDFAHLVPVGRPQLDLLPESSLSPSSLRTIMYAPTWEGENEANNYTSVDVYGLRIVQSCLSIPGTRLIYKPHPRVNTSRNESISDSHQSILRCIEDSNANGGQNVVALEGNILGMFDVVDLMITDVSSVGLDFLYLRPQKQLAITDRRNSRDQLLGESPVARAATIVNDSALENAPEMFSKLLGEDPHESDRLRMRSYYFGDGPVGSSKAAFISEVDRLIDKRNHDLTLFDDAFAEAGSEADDTPGR